MKLLVVFLSLAVLASSFTLKPEVQHGSSQAPLAEFFSMRDCWSCNSIFYYAIEPQCENPTEWANGCPDARSEMLKRCLPCDQNSSCYAGCKRQICAEIDNQWDWVVDMLSKGASKEDICGSLQNVSHLCGPKSNTGCL
ncbi:hypothetical protein L596_026254 [Steinernema carpocapsae]|uniref:Saposin B-type domain-containing protein n=1 Tax=Steinernema carpocapsae TaxID=34508 RepID=A0A4U5M0V3_STECR|nr:hypothetical protein L596_026254 [Steinernema carpocapsae]